ncbi:YdiK family protein [Aquibacillus sediminis]|uniref:YdiK family protein n=1 Tax=Aquibacillus sediminis TaxID=2574734 RepID=UPI001107AA16|nr:YdiK family protein [Aquibacillus sediminis]
MRTSPLFMASLYSGMGILFTFIAIQSVEETIWNFFTLLLIFFATLDFAVAIRLLGLHLKVKKAKKK